MKRVLFILCLTLMAVCTMQAGQVSETDARQVANNFFSQKSTRFTAPSGQFATRLAYTAEHNRFYVYDRGVRGGFVIVAGDDRLPQVLGYGDAGDFSAKVLPPSVQYWMDMLNEQIAYLQDHAGVAAHQPVKRATTISPLVTTQWNQSEPYNNYCPTYNSNGYEVHSAAGCVATATTQVMNYYEWPPVGRGSHSYRCNVNGTTPTELSADFSQSVYRWDLMLDSYDDSSSAESCDAVARLMSDVGIAMDMGYGESSGASEYAASRALNVYFGYCDKYYWLNRNFYSVTEWEQLLVNEISLMRPVMYCGYSREAGHAFVLDGFDADGYFHVNWGWGGYYDGYFLVSLLAPSSGMNFRFGQDALFGMVPETQADAVEDVLYVRGELIPSTLSAPVGTNVELNMDYLATEGNALEVTGYEEWEGRKYYYSEIPMKLSLFDKNGVELKNVLFIHQQFIDFYSNEYIPFDLPQSLEEGEYKFKLFYSDDEGANYHTVLDVSGEDTYVKMIVANDTAYFRDCFLNNAYAVKSIVVPRGVRVNDTFNVSVTLSYEMPWYQEQEDGPTGNVYLSLLKDGVEVASGPLSEVMLPTNSQKTYELQLTAPPEWGFYDVVLCDEEGIRMRDLDVWYGALDVVSAPICILPICQELYEDFETMPANNSTNDQNVQGRFTTWNFGKSGVRAPGEGKCNGTKAVMMKKPSLFYTAQPLQKNFFLAQAIFFNSSATQAKYTLEYSTDGGATWEMAYTIDGIDAVEVEKKSELLVTWNFNLTSDQPVQFRIAMIGGGNGATYVDDLVFYYNGLVGDVNGDGEVNISDVNAVINVILTGVENKAADVNGDGEVNISDVNAIISIILKS